MKNKATIFWFVGFVIMLTLLADRWWISSQPTTATSTPVVGSQQVPFIQTDTAKSISNMPESVEKNTPETVANLWGSAVAFVSCSFQSPADGSIYRIQTGSGGLQHDQNHRVRIMTNKHVITDAATGNQPFECNISVGYPTPSTKYVSFHKDMLVASNGADVAYLLIENPDSYIETLFHPKGIRTDCAVEPPIGAGIVVLGYPQDGSQNSLTLTTGAVSGYEPNYYVTDAKIDHGSSGGIAIDLKNNCFLGMPTWAEAGGFESFGRILKWQAF